MMLRMPDGSYINVPDELSDDEKYFYIKGKLQPPTIGERVKGALGAGVAATIETAAGIRSHIPGHEAAAEDMMRAARGLRSVDYIRRVEMAPPESVAGRLAQGLVEFVPQMPLYAGGEKAALTAMEAIPKLSRVATALKAVPKGPAVKEIPKSAARAAIGGATVGSLGAPPGSTMGERLTRGGEEALAFAGATTVFGTLFRLMGAGGRAFLRSNRSFLEKLEAERQAEILAKVQEAPRESRQAVLEDELKTEKAYSPWESLYRSDYEAKAEAESPWAELGRQRDEIREVRENPSFIQNSNVADVEAKLDKAAEETEVALRLAEASRNNRAAIARMKARVEANKKTLEEVKGGTTRDQEGEVGMGGTERVGETPGRPVQVTPAGEKAPRAGGVLQAREEVTPAIEDAPPAPKEATPKKAFLEAKKEANKVADIEGPFDELGWFEKNRLYDHLELLERGYPLERIKVAEGFERTGPTVLEMTKSEAKAELQKLYDIKVEPPTEHELLAWQERVTKIKEMRPEAGKHRNIGMTAHERAMAKAIADKLMADKKLYSAVRALAKIDQEKQIFGREPIEFGDPYAEYARLQTTAPTPPKASPVRQVEVTPELEAQYLESLAKKEEQTAARELLRKGKGESKIGKLPERIREETPEEVEARIDRRRRRTKKEETAPVTEDEVKKVQAEIDKIAAEEEAGREIKAPKEAEKVDVDVDPNSAEAWERRLSDEGMGVEEGAVDKFMEEEAYNPLWRESTLDFMGLQQMYEMAVENLRKLGPVLRKINAKIGAKGEINFWHGNPKDATIEKEFTLSFMGTGEAEKALKQLVAVSRGIMVEGPKKFSEFRARLREIVGDLWDDIKHMARALWKSATEWYKNSRIGSERGSFSTEAKEPSETMANFRRGLHKFSDEARAWYETSVFGRRPQRDINTLRDVATLMEEKAYEVPKPAAKVIESLSGEKAKVYDIRNKNGPDIVKGSEWIVPTMRTFSSHPGADRAAFEVVAADLTAGHNRGIHFSVIGNAVAGLKEEERKLLRDVIEKGKYASEHIRQAALKISAWLGHMKTRYKAFLTDMYMKHLSEGEMRAVQDVLAGGEVEAVAKGAGMKATTLQSLVNKLNEIDSWGLDPDTYLPRVERGSIKIMERSKDGKGYKVVAVAFSEEHAAEKIAKLLEERPRDLFLDHTMPEYLRDLPTPISPMRAKILNGKIQKAMKEELDKVNKELSKIMRGVYEVRPTKKYTPFEKPRHDVLKGEEDPVPVLFAYAHAMETKMQLDPVIDKVQALLPNLPENMRAAMTTLIEDIKGRRWMSDQVLEEIGKRFGISLEGRPFSRLVSNVKMAEAWMKFAYRPIAGVINAASALGHIWAKTGSKYLAEGLRFMRTEEGKRLLDSVRHLLGTDVVTEMSGKTHEKLHLYHPLGMFQMPEKVMRELAVCANYLLAKSKGLADPAAIEFAVRANWMQNFIYNMAALPRALRVPTGRLLGQFKPYLVQEINFISQLRGQEAVRYLAVMATLGGPIGYIATLRTLPILSMFPWWNDIEEYVNTHAPAASRGIGGLMGVDVTAPATFQFPTRWEEWAGPFLGDLVKVKREVLDPLARGEFLDGSEAARELTSQTIPIAKHWWTAVDQVLDKDGWVKDDRGRRIYHIGESPLDKAAFASKIVAGATDLELSMIRKHERFLKEEARVRARNKQAVVDEILDAVLDGDPITPEMTNVMAELNIKPGSLRRAMKFRMLDAQTRRYLMTEVAKRPELLEEWPELQ